MIDKIMAGLVIIIIVFSVIYSGFSIYGYFTQRESVVIEIIDKRVEQKTYTDCADRDKDGHCTNWRTRMETDYIIVTPNEIFGTSVGLYDIIKVGKKHHVEAAGWKGGWVRRMIIRVME